MNKKSNHSAVNGCKADRDWPYEPDDPDKDHQKNKPDLDFDPGFKNSHNISKKSH